MRNFLKNVDDRLTIECDSAMITGSKQQLLSILTFKREKKSEKKKGQWRGSMSKEKEHFFFHKKIGTKNPIF